jgi:hypothetical protein
VEVVSGPAVLLDGHDCAVLGRQLAQALQAAYGAPGRPMPRHLAEFAGMLNRAARGSREFRVDAQVGGLAGTGEFRDGLPRPSSEEPVRLTIREAALLAGVSEGYMRRCCRRGDVQASRAHRGAFAVDIASLAVWVGEHRKQREKAA